MLWYIIMLFKYGLKSSQDHFCRYLIDLFVTNFAFVLLYEPADESFIDCRSFRILLLCYSVQESKSICEDVHPKDLISFNCSLLKHIVKGVY